MIIWWILILCVAFVLPASQSRGEARAASVFAAIPDTAAATATTDGRRRGKAGDTTRTTPAGAAKSSRALPSVILTASERSAAVSATASDKQGKQGQGVSLSNTQGQAPRDRADVPTAAPPSAPFTGNKIPTHDLAPALEQVPTGPPAQSPGSAGSNPNHNPNHNGNPKPAGGGRVAAAPSVSRFSSLLLGANFRSAASADGEPEGGAKGGSEGIDESQGDQDDDGDEADGADEGEEERERRRPSLGNYRSRSPQAGHDANQADQADQPSSRDLRDAHDTPETPETRLDTDNYGEGDSGYGVDVSKDGELFDDDEDDGRQAAGRRDSDSGSDSRSSSRREGAGRRPIARRRHCPPSQPGCSADSNDPHGDHQQQQQQQWDFDNFPPAPETGLERGDRSDAKFQIAPYPLIFPSTSVCIPAFLEVTVWNRNAMSVDFEAIDTSLEMVHAVGFSPQHVPPGGNVLVQLMYLPHIVGTVTATLTLRSSIGSVFFNASGSAIQSPYNAFPITGLRVPIPPPRIVATGIPATSALYDQPIALHNPHTKPLYVREIYSSESWLTIVMVDINGRTIPTPPAEARSSSGEILDKDKNKNGAHSTASAQSKQGKGIGISLSQTPESWSILPGMTQTLVKIQFSLLVPGIFTGLVHVRTDRCRLIIPVKVI